MKDEFKFILNADMFERVKNGTKTIHIILADNEHKNLQEKNQIQFALDGTAEIVNAEIEKIYVFDQFLTAVESFGKEKCGFNHNATFEKTSDLFLSQDFSYEKIEKYGVIALEFKLI